VKPKLPPTMMRMKREALGLSQAELAERIGVSQGKISSWESGTVSMPEVRRKQISKVLGIEPDHLMKRFSL